MVLLDIFSPSKYTSGDLNGLLFNSLRIARISAISAELSWADDGDDWVANRVLILGATAISSFGDMDYSPPSFVDMVVLPVRFE